MNQYIARMYQSRILIRGSRQREAVAVINPSVKGGFARDTSSEASGCILESDNQRTQE